MPKDLLSDIPLFKTLKPEERQELSSLLRRREFPAQAPVVWLGEKGDEFYLVQTGKLTASCPDETGKEVILGTLGPGHFFGEISLLDGGPRTATVRAVSDSALLALGREDFLEFLRRHPDAAIHMLGILGQRQRETLEKVRGIRNANEAIDQSRSNWQRIAEQIATASASRSFVVFNLGLFFVWIVLNIALSRMTNPPIQPWDSAPTFAVLGLVVTIEALFISLFVLISQGFQGERDRIRADLDYQVNLKAHQEVMQLHQKVDRLHQLVTKDEGAKPVEDRMPDNPLPATAEAPGSPTTDPAAADENPA